MVKLQVKLGIAPIAWTNDDMPDLGKDNNWKQALSDMAFVGYQGTEVGRQYPRDPVILNKQLELRNLSIASAWFSSYILQNGFQKNIKKFRKHCEFLANVGAKVVVVSEQSSSIQGKMHTPVYQKKPVIEVESDWLELARGLDGLGKIAHEYGLQVCYHHHMGTIIQTFEELKKIMSITDPKYVSIVLDTGHFAYSKEDPVKMVEHFSERIKHVHLKDIRLDVVKRVEKEEMSFLQGIRMGTFTIPGDGAIDFDGVFKALKKFDYRGWLIVEAEQDPTIADPLKYAIQAMKFIKSHIEIISP